MSSLSDHPVPQRIFHWINLINFIVLGVTGYLIHAPYQGIPMNLIRNLHFIFMYLLLINGIVRFYYSFFGKHKDYNEFLLYKRDWKALGPQLKYYLFLGAKPQTGKYNPLQKLAYIALPCLAVLLGITGAIMYWPNWLASFANLLGGMAAVRGIHYLSFWLVIAILIVHLYLVFTEAYDNFWVMFFGRVRQKRDV